MKDETYQCVICCVMVYPTTYAMEVGPWFTILNRVMFAESCLVRLQGFRSSTHTFSELLSFPPKITHVKQTALRKPMKK